MKLKIVTPLAVVVNEDIDSLRAEDASGSFGILEGHAPFLTSLAISIVSWRKADHETFCAVRGGVMTVSGATEIAIASREAVPGDDITTLDTDVLARFHADMDAERVEHVETVRLQLHAIRRMISRMQSSGTFGEFQ